MPQPVFAAGSHFPQGMIDLSKLVQKGPELSLSAACVLGMCVRDMLPMESMALDQVVPVEVINTTIRHACFGTKPTDWEVPLAAWIAQMFGLVIKDRQAFAQRAPEWHALWVSGQEAIAKLRTPEQARTVCNEGGEPCNQADCSYCNHLPGQEAQ